MRFSVKTLLIITAFVALSIAGLLYANPVWATFFTTIAVFLILFAIVAADETWLDSDEFDCQTI
jgi:hypothetical protein